MFNYFKKFKEQDEITEFRLINSFLVSVGFAILAPIIIVLKGAFLMVWVISLFSIAATLAVKSNKYLTEKFTISELYKLGIFIHLMFIISTLFYFLSPVLMVWLDSSLVILETAVFSSYSILLNNYITDNFPKSMQSFQVIRNSSWADGSLLGLSLITLVTYFSTTEVGLIVFIIYNFLFSLWLIYNWSFFDNKEYL